MDVLSKVATVKRTLNGKVECYVATIIVAEPDFCFMVVPKLIVAPDCFYTVRLFDNSVHIKLTSDLFLGENGQLAGLYVDRGTNHGINAFDFGEGTLTEFDEVKMCDIDAKEVFFISEGRVNQKKLSYFLHDCATSNLTLGYGAPVFVGADDLLYGINYPTTLNPNHADTCAEILYQLLKMVKGGGIDTLDEFLEHVRRRRL